MNAGDAADQVIRQVDKMIKNTERALRDARLGKVIISNCLLGHLNSVLLYFFFLVVSFINGIRFSSLLFLFIVFAITGRSTIKPVTWYRGSVKEKICTSG